MTLNYNGYAIKPEQNSQPIPWYDTNVSDGRFQFWTFEHGVTLHCHFFPGRL